MKKIFSDVQPAVKKETTKVAASTLIGIILMWIGFAVFHFIFPEKVPFDYTVFLGGIGGGIVAVLNFFLMGLAVQKVAATEDEEMARMRMKASYSRRMLLQILWIIAVAVAPCFALVAGLLPLLFPSIGIKLRGILKK
nr:ATP synthase subunit I [uncultured Blautia sp.]